MRAEGYLTSPGLGGVTGVTAKSFVLRVGVEKYRGGTSKTGAKSLNRTGGS